MNSRSSIFSFNTLHVARAARRVPRSLLLAAGLILAAEVAVRCALDRTPHALPPAALWPYAGKIHRDPSAQGLIASYVYDLEQKKPQVWFLGNSTLDQGMDDAAFSSASGRSAIKMPIGSATIRASAEMLGYYLDRAPQKPQTVILFASKDDMNGKGYRASVSKEFQDIAAGKLLHPQRHLALYAARADIQNVVAGPFEKVAKALTRKSAATASVDTAGLTIKKENHYDGKPITPDNKEHAFFVSLLKDYEFDAGAFDTLAQVAHSRGVLDIVVVLTPPTDQYINFHKQHVPGLSYDQIRAQVAAACTKNQIRLIDAGEPSSNYTQFQDPYHLNGSGRTWFTHYVLEQYAKSSATAAGTNASTQQ